MASKLFPSVSKLEEMRKLVFFSHERSSGVLIMTRKIKIKIKFPFPLFAREWNIPQVLSIKFHQLYFRMKSLDFLFRYAREAKVFPKVFVQVNRRIFNDDSFDVLLLVRQMIFPLAFHLQLSSFLTYAVGKKKLLSHHILISSASRSNLLDKFSLSIFRRLSGGLFLLVRVHGKRQQAHLVDQKRRIFLETFK